MDIGQPGGYQKPFWALVVRMGQRKEQSGNSEVVKVQCWEEQQEYCLGVVDSPSQSPGISG